MSRYVCELCGYEGEQTADDDAAAERREAEERGERPVIVCHACFERLMRELPIERWRKMRDAQRQ